MGGILFIDAEQPFSEQTASALRARGFQVTQLDDGKDGLDHAAKEKPDLIVLCVELPKMSGYSICNKLKKDNDLKGIPLIITSKEATPETFAQHKKLKTRAEDYLIKPFTEGDLVEKIGALIPLPAGDVGAPSSAPAPAADAFESLDSLSRELELDPTGIPPIPPDALDDELGSLDSPGSAPPAEVSADSLLDGLDSLGDGGLGGGLDDLGSLDAPASASPAADLGSLDDGLDALAEAEAPPPPPKAPPRAAAATPSLRPQPSTSTSTSSSSADLAALQTARRENSDLKARVAELEARLRQAEDAARAASSASMPPTGAQSAREVLNLKQQLRAKDDEILQKEQAIVDAQEQLEQVQAEAQQKAAEVGQRDIEVSTLKARVDALAAERDDLEAQVRDRLQAAEAERDQLRGELDGVRDDLTRQLDDMTQARDDAAARAQRAEQELRAKEQEAARAWQKVKAEEQLRDKARQAADSLARLLAGDGKGASGAELEL